MRHAILGAGGVGGLLAAALARADRDVLVVMRPETLDAFPGGFHVESEVLGEFDVDVPARSRVDRDVDVLWVAVKATQMEAAIALAAPAVVRDAVVVPLLNGIDHVARLREVYGDVVVPGAIRVESERVTPGYIVQVSTFAAVELAPPPALRERAMAIAEEVDAAGLACIVRQGEADVLWGKLAMLAPIALATSAAGQAVGAARDDPEVRGLMLASVREVCAVGASEGARLDAEAYVQTLLRLPDEMRSSMQKDLAAGRQPELDAIAGPVLRGGVAHGIPTPATEELANRVAQRAAV
jgi:2-dehydropantoate 2-reductase